MSRHQVDYMQTVQQHLQADGFAFDIDPTYELRAATVTCEPPGDSRFSFDVYRIYHYTKLTDYRQTENPEIDWEEQLTKALSLAQMTIKVGALKAELDKLPADRQQQLKRELEEGSEQ